MNSAEQTVTWLITLGVLDSPKKSISDPEAFLQLSLQDGAVLCRLVERLRPGTVDKFFQEPRSDGESQRNIAEFIKGCGSFGVEPFEVSDLLQGLNFSKVLNCLVALNKATEDFGVSGDSVCVSHSSASRIKSFDSLNTQSRSPKLLLPQYRSLDMSEGSGCGHLLVKARFPFQQTNEDELSFCKGDIISVSKQEDGGWWEGSLNGKTGWFPSNYVRELKGSDKTPDKPKSGTLKSPPKGFDTTIISKTYYNVVLQNILEAESEYSRELQSLLGSYMRSLHPTDRLSAVDISHIQGNLEEISTFQQMLVQSLEEHTKLPENQQKIGGFFLSLMPQIKIIYVAYCSNHPSAVNVLTQHSEVLGEYMESKGASTPGILTLTTSLSKPFTRLERYPTLLKELDRHMEDQHPDRADLLASMASFKSLAAQCLEVRKKKDLELQILTEPIRNWEGDDIRTLGPVQHMSQATVHTQDCQESNERYLVLFPHTLLMLSASLRMSGFIYQGRMPLSGMLISRIEDGETMRNAFEISGAQCERIQVACNNQNDLQEWLDLLTKHTHTSAVQTHKHQSVCHTLPSHPVTPTRHSESRGVSSGHTYHTLPHPSSYGTAHSGSPMWGPLEPPSTPKPWSLSCLRPAPPLRPSAALCYKEDMSKSPKNMKKLLPKRKPERKPSEEDFTVRKSTAALEEDAQILKVIEAYCTSAKTRQTLNSSSSRKDVHMLFPEEEKIIVEETKSNGQTVVEERSLVDTVYSLKDEVQELKQDNKRMKRTLEEEQRARKELERVIRRVLKSMDDPTWDETNL
ncbi:putative rho guanine nucleotide exchange factor 7 isoform 2 [Scophthalmus maximus]|uniref:Osteoclast-stimulating factor 1 n=1 Tax=Scophthalmus maximus TaxID=52904 RepID=A0A2U9AVM3_SCOMX|nr:rho guanine nucleotide exchange factor 7b isoform X1 [Scophthalmus maximus]AWO95713.1 putative rho guanine nucleotide exchange factor 7 [Scophthalmus maximus]AWO95714.1 putative rho guanine nucleotide exchange factor 7 isoform 2 [Scophthalmus maximus]